MSKPLASQIRTDTSAFNGILSANDTDIQKALDTLDDLDLSIYVPYTGATADVDLGLFNIYSTNIYLPKTVDNATGIIWKYNNTISAYQAFLHDYGTQNLFLGRNCGNFTTTGTYNFILGSESGNNLTTGSENLMFGYSTGVSMTDGSYNLLLGTAAGLGISSGSYNIIIGPSAGSYLSTENYQLCIGENFGTPVIGGDLSTGWIDIPSSMLIGNTVGGGTGANLEIDGQFTGIPLALTTNGSDWMLLYQDAYGANIYYPGDWLLTGVTPYMYFNAAGVSIGIQGEGIQPATSPLTVYGDLDLQTYKAIALCCDNGFSLPTSPAPKVGQWFLQDTTGRKVLFMYDGSDWIPIYNFGTMTIYVDGTNGTDDQNLGYSTGTEAFRTIQFAIDQIPPTNAGSVTVNVAAGTYSEAVTIGGKNFTSGSYTLTVKGAAFSSPVISATRDSYSQGGSSTNQPSPDILTDTGAFAGTNYLGYFFTKDDSAFYPIVRQTGDDVIYIADNTITSCTTYKVYAPPTTIISRTSGTNLTIGANQVNVYIYNIKFTNSGTGSTISTNEGSSSNFYYCHCQSGNVNAGTSFSRCRFTISNSWFYQANASRWCVTLANGTSATINYSGIYVSSSGTCVRVNAASYLAGNLHCIIGTGTQQGWSLISSGGTIFNSWFYNLATGVNADMGSAVTWQNVLYGTFDTVTTPVARPIIGAATTHSFGDSVFPTNYSQFNSTGDQTFYGSAKLKCASYEDEPVFYDDDLVFV